MKKISCYIFAIMLAMSSIATSYAVDSPSAPVYSDTDTVEKEPESPKTGFFPVELILGAAAALSIGCVAATKKASK